MSTPPPVMPPPPPMSPAPQAGGPPIQNYMAWSIIVTILGLCFCCGVGSIPGIVGIVFASKANNARDRGDFAEATRNADTAKLWCWIGTALVVVGLAWSGLSWSRMGGLEGYKAMIEAAQHAQK